MTQVNWTRQAGLAALLLALGSTAYWLEYKHKPQKESLEEQSKKLFSLKDVPVRGLLLVDGAGHTYELRCTDASGKLCKPGDNSKWEVTQPLKLKADDSNANALVSALNNLTINETIDLKDETPEKRAALLREYGLDPQSRALPAAKRIEVTTPSGMTVVYLGFNHPMGDSIFGLAENVPPGQKPSAKLDDTHVYLVPTYFKANFDHDLTYWRDKKLLTASAHEIDFLKLVSTKVNLTGTRKDGTWTLKTAKNEEFPGDIENIDNLLTAVTFLSAKGFVADKRDDPQAVAALKGAKQVLQLSMQQEKGLNKELPAPIVLTLFLKTPKLYATVSNLDPVYELDATSRERVDKETKDLRLTKLITSMERFSAKRLEFNGQPLGNTPLILKNQEGKWSLEGDKAEPSNEKIQSFLDRLSGNRIQEFLEGSKIPSGEAVGLSFKLGDEKDGVKRQLSFWKNGGKLYARDLLSKRKEAYRVDPSIEAELPWTRDAFAKKEPPALPAGTAPPLGGGSPQGRGQPWGAPGAPPEPGRPLIPVPPALKKQ